MTQKEINRLAGIVKERRDELCKDGGHLAEDLYVSLGETRIFAKKLATWLTTQDPEFDTGRFLKACGIEMRKGRS